MARLSELSDAMRETVTTLDCPPFEAEPWVPVESLARRTVTLISSAGIGLRSQPPFRGGEGGYRSIPDAAPDADILMSHVSVNYDRVGFQRDLEVILPRRRLRELAAQRVIGAAADRHYSFMGATAPAAMETQARALASQLHARGVDTAVLLPV